MDGKVAAFAGEAESDGAPQALRAAGDESHPAVQFISVGHGAKVA